MVFPWKMVWRSLAPYRVAVFAWELANEAILTGDNLRRRRKIYVNWCFLCKGDEESVNHLMLHCPVASELWNLVFGLMNLSWVMRRSVKDLLLTWSVSNAGGGKGCGSRSLWVCFGQFGRKEMAGFLRTRKDLFSF